MKKAVCIGINNYPGTQNDLKGCVNDANNWSEFLTGLGFETSIILDKDATKKTILNSLTAMAQGSQEEDILVFTYSGHGTQLVDQDGDEEDGYDEALYVYDGAISDDDIRWALKAINEDSVFVVVMDSCFSGTATRVRTKGSKPKFLKTAKNLKSVPKKKLFRNQEEMKELFLAGCSDQEYSYDAFISGQNCGAFSYYALKVLGEGLEKSYDDFYKRLREFLPSTRYPQTPQLEGSDANRNLKLFVEKQKPPPPPPIPTVDIFEAIYNFFKKIYDWIVNLF